ncbi:acyltransferase family protein [Streptomyces palmae]|uniref:Acyltransferase 3 domain-containing protein n=1 Tax=Streptomyces palmae TaxID=1701085 RepID=A0A4Z0G2I5_9ACTN|nr:acyltransferase family protein [Streptomyces palmae]TGA88857.1 hypothetical protein E4099_29460 [Streptomyces palmae]
MTSGPRGGQRMPLPPARQADDVGSPPGQAGPEPAAAAGSQQTATVGPRRARAAGAKPRQRDAFFDNAKFMAIVLVAMGHAWEPLRDDSRLASALYITVYSFHMPAFIVISGYFSRSFDMRPDRLRRLITGIGVPYVIFEIAYTFFKRWADDDPTFDFSLLDPWYLTWFLIALFVWRMTTPLWQVIRWPIPVSLLIAALAAVSPDIGDDLDMQRVLQFLPFFVVGLNLKRHHFDMVRGIRARKIAIPVFAGALLVAYWAAPRMNAAWFYRRDSAQELAAPWWDGVMMTGALFCCSMVLTACFFAWVPKRRMFFTVLGAGTLYGYLLHGFLAKGSRFWDWYDHDWVHEPLGELAVTVIAATVVTVLCTSPVQRMFRFAMEPKMTWAFRKDPAPSGGGKRG